VIGAAKPPDRIGIDRRRFDRRLKGHAMARTLTKAEFKHTVPIKVSRPRFKLSTAFANIDAEKISSKANVEVDVGTFEGDGSGRVVSAIVKKARSSVSRFRLAPKSRRFPWTRP
jgi:hypothetical protein